MLDTRELLEFDCIFHAGIHPVDPVLSNRCKYRLVLHPQFDERLPLGECAEFRCHEAVKSTSGRFDGELFFIVAS